MSNIESRQEELAPNEEKLSPELLAICEEMREYLFDNGEREIETNYKLAALALKAKNQAKYGQGALEKLERKLGLKSKTLYTYAKVAEIWSDDEVGAFLVAAHEAKTTVSWSHLVTVLSVDVAMRDALLLRAIKQGLSVRDLAEAVKGAQPPPKQRTPAEVATQALTSARRALEKAVECASGFVSAGNPEEIATLRRITVEIAGAVRSLEAKLNVTPMPPIFVPPAAAPVSPPPHPAAPTAPRAAPPVFVPSALTARPPVAPTQPQVAASPHPDPRTFYKSPYDPRPPALVPAPPVPGIGSPLPAASPATSPPKHIPPPLPFTPTPKT